tara:strand:+ start:910 stop:1536 length:627 start_codon:yes stop_codon:yes gene_type:complete
VIKWIVEFKSVSAKIAFASLSAALTFGQFLKAKFLNETIGISESQQKATAKNLQNTFLAKEETSLSTAKTFEDLAGASDNQTVDIGKVKLDALSFTDNVEKLESSKVLNNQADFQDVFSKSAAYQRSIVDVFSATDDIDGTATAEDDQEVSFIKVKSEPFSLSDNALLNFSKAIFESYSIGDSGQLISQNYAEVNYFSDDYVGFAQSF